MVADPLRIGWDIRRNDPMPLRIAYRRILWIIHVWVIPEISAYSAVRYHVQSYRQAVQLLRFWRVPSGHHTSDFEGSFKITLK
jgi:hypothetical protein